MPELAGYPESPATIGEHIRKKRMDLKLHQRAVARSLNVTKDTIYSWENNRNLPQVGHYPKIIKFLGYLPFEVDDSTILGKLKAYRYINGLTQEKIAQLLKVDESCYCNWEKGQGKPLPYIVEKMEEFLRQVSEIE